jgi:hypothetical protein
MCYELVNWNEQLKGKGNRKIYFQDFSSMNEKVTFPVYF